MYLSKIFVGLTALAIARVAAHGDYDYTEDEEYYNSGVYADYNNGGAAAVAADPSVPSNGLVERNSVVFDPTSTHTISAPCNTSTISSSSNSLVAPSGPYSNKTDVASAELSGLNTDSTTEASDAPFGSNPGNPARTGSPITPAPGSYIINGASKMGMSAAAITVIVFFLFG